MSEYKIAVLLPTRSRTTALTQSISSIVKSADDLSNIQLLLGFDDDDAAGLNHFSTVIQPWLDQTLDLAEIRIFDGVGAEKFAEHAFNFADSLIRKATDNRCYCVRVECAEHGANSAIYEG